MESFVAENGASEEEVRKDMADEVSRRHSRQSKVSWKSSSSPFTHSLGFQRSCAYESFLAHLRKSLPQVVMFLETFQKPVGKK